MKRIFIICLLAILSVNPTFADSGDTGAVLNANASMTATDVTNDTALTTTPEDVAPQAIKSTGDPTLDFFVALTQCVPGSYNEKNVLADETGETWLKQKIVTMDSDICYAQLSTPDNRTMYCEFPFSALTTINEQHFMHGILVNTSEDPSADAVHADKVWSDLKSQYCSFTGE